MLRLRRALADVADAYDVTIVDTRPSANVLTLGALRAATHLILVAEPRLHAAQGIARLRGADSQARRLDPDPPDRHDGVVANLVEGGHRRLDPRRTKELRDHYGDAVWTELPRRVAVAEAAERHPPPGDPSAPRDARRWAERLLPVADRIHP